MIITNVLQFTVEFLKMYLGVVGIFKIKQKKKVFFFYLAAVLLITTVSLFINNMEEHSYIYAILIIAILAMNSRLHKKVWVIPALYIMISTIDVLNSLIIIKLMPLTIQEMHQQPMIHIGINCITLVLICLLCVYMHIKRKEHIDLSMARYGALYILGGISASIYLTCAQLSLLNNFRYGNLLIIGLITSGVLFFVTGALLFYKTNENEYLRREGEINKELLEAQEKYCSMLLVKNKEIRSFRHDIKNHLYCMALLAEKKDYDGLTLYLKDMGESLERTQYGTDTGNEMVSAILSDLKSKYEEVSCEWQGILQKPFLLSNYDTCTIFYNLLSNAFEAAVQAEYKRVMIDVKYLNRVMYLIISNTYKTKPVKAGQTYVTSKTEGDHGFGITNARNCVEKNGGTYEARSEKEYFVTEVIIPEL